MVEKKYKVLGITLARGGSKSVTAKNIRLMGGAPLIAYTIAEALRSRHITRYIVSTDNEEIRRVAVRYGAEAPFLRPANLATDQATSMDALQHAVRWIEEQEACVYDYVIELMCTNPMKTVGDVDGALEKLMATGADSVIGMSQLEDHHPARIKKIVDDQIVDFCVPEIINSRRQDLKPSAYIRNGSIYAMRRDSLMKDNARYGTQNSRPYVMPAERFVNVDSPLDFKIAELLLKEYPRPYVKTFSELAAERS